MKLAFIRIRSNAPARITPRSSEVCESIARTGSSSKNLILALRERQVLTSVEEWQFVSGDVPESVDRGQIPVKFLPANPSRVAASILDHVGESGAPDILWIEGMRHPAHLNVLLRACPASFKIVYSKHWEPWAVERLDSFDLCLLDEQHQVHQVQKRYPAVHCGVWDKLVDYERTHRPVECQKAYDLCYVAYLRRRKNHELLFSALSKLRARGLSCVCVGEDRKGYRSHLEQRATQLGLQVDFTGEVSPVQVNDYVNRSRIGVICSRRDAVPRAILEYLAADVPVLVNSELVAGTRYVGATAGLTRSPEQFHVGIEQLLGNLQQYTPRRHYLANFSTDQVVRRFVRILTSAGLSIASGSRAQLGVV